ncbi:ABC transporter substrate-binding protein [Pelagibacterium sp. 26DY04]|uniref:ABC transporter substrate-binding protein n=1 Tax=Pelagibacterium sp. 26DY04 TaxID=2967130 RepID=UPI0028159EFA|nr:ABC transporter substrate-binding protein [Pelagibacterium sp. 26DY04]WMT87501.1 ABC transporter substrate-binding protein [Pelagibacterium sp. 26DY04]
MTTITRRNFLAGATALATAGLAAPALANTTVPSPIRIGTVFPARTGASFIRASVNDFIGTAGRMGALLADTQLGTGVEAQGARLDVLLSTSPTVEAAVRAGERLVETENICALVGGVGEGQAQVLAEIAARAQIPFFNVGETSDAFRREAASPYLFHIEASDAMYLDALGLLAAEQGLRRWAVVSDTGDRGAALADRAERAAEKSGCMIVGTVMVPPALPVYFAEIEELAALDADVIFVLADYQDQFPLMIQMEESGITTPTLSFPHSITQTRDFIAASRNRLPILNPRHRVALWDTTNTGPGAEDFNLQIRARYAEPADPTAWAAFHAIKIVIDTVMATGSTEAEAIIAHLEKPETTFDVAKGVDVSFRPWDHQLRQPLAVLEIDDEVVWRQLQLATRIDVARYTGSLPAGEPEDDVAQWLDVLGDGPEEA